MRGRQSFITAVLCALIAVFAQSFAHAFPDREITGAVGGPPLNFGFTDNASSFFLKNNRTLLVAYGERLAVADLAFYDLPEPQPFDILADEFTENNSPFLDAVYLPATDEVLVVQSRGHALIYRLAAPDAEPIDVIVAEGKELGTVVVNTNETYAYIGNNSDGTIHRLNLSTLEVDATVTVTIPNQPNFVFTDGVFVPTTASAYFATDGGAVVVLPDAGSTVQIVDVDTLNGDVLNAIAATPNGAFVYATNRTFNELVKIDASSLAVLADIDLLPNTAPVDVLALNVTNPNTTYIYVAGGNGVSVVDMNSNVVLDMGDGADDHEPIPTSSAPKKFAGSSDGYVYMSLSTTAVGIISENPWVAVTDVAYTGGGSAMGAGEAVIITFAANEDGTYEMRAGGDIDRSGSLLTDSIGNTSGAAIADTAVPVEIPYDANSTLFDEGENSVFVFVTDSEGNVGRYATTVMVDTPPDIVTLIDTGFGSGRVYIDFERLTASDMSHYHMYVDVDPDAVLTKAEVGALIEQPASGTTVTGSVGDLENGTVYYIAVEGIDEAGNVSASRAYLLPDGSRASATPQVTVGPAGFSGEKGCALTGSSGSGSCHGMIMMALVLATLIVLRTGHSRRLGAFVYIVAVLVFVSGALVMPTGEIHAREKERTPQWWSLELKSGFWMPTAWKTKRFFDSCCNIVTRVQGGLLVDGKYGAELGVGFMIKDGNAIGMQTGEQSFDRFSFFLLPIETNFVWRLDYWDWRYIVPYFKTGIDYVYFRENVRGAVTEGVKYGAHGVAGISLPLIEYSDDVMALDKQYGLNDIHFTMEAQYQWINDFGGGGLDLSGWVFSAGFLFAF